MENIQLIINPYAGRGAAARIGPHVARRLSRYGFDCAARLTNEPKHATNLVKTAVEDGADTIVVVGGDGSINECVNGLAKIRRKINFGIIPVGTGNDFIKMLDMPRDWEYACERIRAGNIKKVDIGKCNKRYFANGVGIGFDAQVAFEANQIRWLKGNLVYGAALLKTLTFCYQTPLVKITLDDREFEQAITMLAVANGRCYGGAFNIAPRADVTDGKFEIVVAEGMNRRQILKLVPDVLRGTHLDKSNVQSFRTDSVTIESETPLRVHLDGEIPEEDIHKLAIKIKPGAINVIC
ncbi:MAG: diacylglycerol kinase family lipid kinase [Gammaproteobacteria bacterium]|nr:diacylglycerol kinase family lipid kinase [Gammaproteobacteria bacterium]